MIAILPALLGPLFGQRREHPRRWWLELAWLVGVGVLFAISATWLLAGAHTSLAYYATDFDEYCVAIMDWRDSTLPGTGKRSRAAAYLPFFLAEWTGILDGIALASVLSTGIIGAGLYLWARVVHSRYAGLVAAGFALAMAPMVALSRFLTFYPEIVATLVTGAALCALAIRSRHPLAYVGAGLGIGACLLVDLRGLVWALPYFFGTLAAALVSGGRWPMRLLRTLCLIAPLVLAWWAGPIAYPVLATSLERQIDVRPLYVGFDGNNPLLQPPWTYASSYVWGRSSLTDLPGTLDYLVQQARIPTPPGFIDWQTQEGSTYLQDWMLTAGAGGLLALIGLARRRPELWALGITVFPFVVALHGTGSMVERHFRFMTHGLPGVAVLAGIGVAVLARWRPPGRAGPPSWARAAVLVGTIALLLSGVVPSAVAPTAAWRPKWIYANQSLPRAMAARIGLYEYPDHQAYQQTCTSGLAAEYAAGYREIRTYSRWPWAWPTQPLGREPVHHSVFDAELESPIPAP